MELTIALAISILSIVFTILNFVNGRKDKSNKDTSDSSYRQGQLDMQIKNIFEKLEKIDKKLDTYDKELDDKIEKAVQNHVVQFHNK